MKNFIYKITQNYCKEDVQYVSIDKDSGEFELLLGYIIFKFEDITEDYPLIAYDMAERLLPLYGGKKENAPIFFEEEAEDEFEIDLHYIREHHCATASKIESMDRFYHPKLKETLTMILDEIVFQNS